MSTDAGTPPPYVRTVIGLALAGLAAFGELYGVQSLLPLVARDFGVSPVDAALAQSAASVGVAVGVVPWSLAARRWGSGPALRAAVLLTAVLAPVIPLLGTLDALVVARFAHGLVLAGIPAIALVHIARSFDARTAVAASGWYIAGTSIGGPLGRLVSGVPGDLADDWRWGMAAVSLMSVVAAVACVILLRGQAGAAPAHDPAVHTPGSVWRDRRLWLIYVFAVLGVGAFTAVYNYFGFELVGPVFQLPDLAIPLVYLAYGFGTITSILTPRLVYRFGRRTVMVLALTAQLAGTLLTAVPSLLVALVGLAVLTMGFFASHSTAGAWAAQLGRGGTAASAGYTLSFYLGGGVIGWAGGLVYGDGHWVATAGAMGAALAVALLAFVVLLPRRSRHESDDPAH